MQDYQQIKHCGVFVTPRSVIFFTSQVFHHTQNILQTMTIRAQIFKPLSVSSAQSIDCYVETICDIEQLTAFLNLYSRMRNKMKKITNCELPITTEL